MDSKEEPQWVEQRKQDRSLFDAYRKTGLLTTRLFMIAILENFYWREALDRSSLRKPSLSEQEAAEVCAATDRIHAVVKVFEGAVWFLGGLQEKVKACKLRGMEGQADGWSVLIYAMARRCMLTFRDAATEQSLTLITADDEEPFDRQEWGNKDMGPMGIQGLDCTESTARKLLIAAIRGFPEVQPSETVGIA